ncbi:MAG: 2-oxoglutarate dehydrogenase E1 [Bacillota bacterium]|jgi:hypothetical protein|nr:MAG: 2-oxoglutarate dehydrogenase E1 [Bacillota bacterium]
MIRGLSLTQPHASLVSIEAKKIETRSWSTSYRGWLAIHAAKGFPAWARALCLEEPFHSHLQRHLLPQADPKTSYLINPADGLPLGVIVAVTEVYDCRPTSRPMCGTFAEAWVNKLSEQEYAFGDYSRGRHGLFLRNTHRLPEPIPCKGALGLWRLPPDVEQRIREQLPAVRW